MEGAARSEVAKEMVPAKLVTALPKASPNCAVRVCGSSTLKLPLRRSWMRAAAPDRTAMAAEVTMSPVTAVSRTVNLCAPCVRKERANDFRPLSTELKAPSTGRTAAASLLLNRTVPR